MSACPIRRGRFCILFPRGNRPAGSNPECLPDVPDAFLTSHGQGKQYSPTIENRPSTLHASVMSVPPPGASGSRQQAVRQTDQ